MTIRPPPDGPALTSMDPEGGPTLRQASSWRDPAGFVFLRHGVLYRQINRLQAAEWDALAASGLLERLQGREWLIPHETVGIDSALDPAVAHAVIRPVPVEFVSYPYEWSFGQLKDAALLTLAVQAEARSAGFTLRDASAFNVQFVGGRPTLIDTLSFEPIHPGEPWRAYAQFCRHFVAPLALAAYRDPRCLRMLAEFIDGLPLDLSSALLPWRTRLRLGLGSHVHLHARADKRVPSGNPKRARMGQTAHEALIEGLRSTIEGLRWDPDRTEWADYDSERSHYGAADIAKDRIVAAMLESTTGRRVWDLGANTGRYSRIAARIGRSVIAWDSDYGATEKHYRAVRASGERSVLPLVIDLANPSPALGWSHAERLSWLERADADVALALALVHHLALRGNVPLGHIASLVARLAPEAIVEWVPADDPMAAPMLIGRERLFTSYTKASFIAALEGWFEILEDVPIEATGRSLLRLRRRAAAS